MLALTVQNPTNWIKKRSSSSPELCGCNVTPCVYCVLRLLFWVKSAVDGHQCCKVSLLVSQKHWPSVWPPRRKILSLIVSGAEIWTQMTQRTPHCMIHLGLQLQEWIATMSQGDWRVSRLYTALGLGGSGWLWPQRCSVLRSGGTRFQVELACARSAPSWPLTSCTKAQTAGTGPHWKQRCTSARVSNQCFGSLSTPFSVLWGGLIS